MKGQAKAFVVAAAGMWAACAPPAAAQVVPNQEAALRQQLEEMRAREQAAISRIDALEQRLRALEGLIGLDDGSATLVDDQIQAAMRGRGAVSGVTAQTYGDQVAVVSAQTPGATAPGELDTASAEEETRKSPAPTEAVETVTRSEQGYFGDRLTFETGLTYTHFDDARLNLSGFLALDAIFLGLISIDEITADILTLDFTTRYGVTDRLQVDLNVPYLYRHSNFQSGGAGGNASGLIEADLSDHGIGDISAGVSYRVLSETLNRPDVVVNARIKAPTGRHAFGVELVEVEGSEGNLEIPETLSTGTGVWSAGAGVSILKTLDPLVVFGSLSYFYNFDKNFPDVDELPGEQPGLVKLGNAIQYGAGIAFALNERSSISMSFTQRFVERTRIRRVDQEIQSIVGSQANVGILNLGATFAITDRISLLTNVGIGMTADAPDMVLGLRVPFRF